MLRGAPTQTKRKSGTERVGQHGGKRAKRTSGQETIQGKGLDRVLNSGKQGQEMEEEGPVCGTERD